MLSENTLTSRPTDIIAGFPVRPGFFELNGATPLSNGGNFTAHTTVHPANFFFSTTEKRNPSQSFLFPMPVVSVMSTP